MREDIFEEYFTSSGEVKRVKIRTEYSDGTPKTFYPGKPWLNKYGYSHATEPCRECGEWECDQNGVGHYRG